MEKLKQDKRLYGLDILRILSMIFITFIHFFSYTNILSSPNLSKANYIILNVFKSFTVASVSIFIMITGYFQCTKKVNYKRLFTLWVNVIVVSVILFIVMLIVERGGFSLSYLIKSVLPISTMHYWFLVMYVLLCISAPMLNLLIEKMSKSIHFWVCVLGFVIICVYFASNPFVKDEIYLGNARGIIWFYYLYVFAAYIKKYNFNIKPWLLAVLTIISFAGVFILNYLKKDTIKGVNLLAGYSILPFVFAVCCFLIFKQISVKGKVIKKIISLLSACAFYVYIIQEHDAVRTYLWNNIINFASYASNWHLILVAILFILALWPLAFILERITALLSKGINFIYIKIEKLVVKIANKINIKLNVKKEENSIDK